MARKHSIGIAVVAAILVAGAVWAWPYVQGLWPAIGPAGPIPSGSSLPEQSGMSGPLTAADGRTATLLTDAVPAARDLVLDPLGNVWVSQPSQGTVSLVTVAEPTLHVSAVLRNLDRPHGLAFHPTQPFLLYIAEETRIIRINTYAEDAREVIATLPEGGRHFTRSLAFGSDGRLYVSIGSTCDVCYEDDPENGAIISMNPDGSDRQIVATGLRNAVFLIADPREVAHRPGTEAPVILFATEMGRDHLGDHLPPDEVNIIEATAPVRDYGWPICYGDRVHDTQFDQNQYVRDPCADTVAPVIELPAHVAPLGLAILPDGDLLIAYHGSWNSTVPVGYKVVRWHRDGSTWTSSDFLTGFLVDGSAFGRPVDVLPMPDGSVLVSDDKAGAIWQVTAQP